MKQRLIDLYAYLSMFGIDPLKFFNSMRGLLYYLINIIKFKKQSKNTIKKFPFGRFYPCLGDRFLNSGSAIGHYFHQDLLIARRIYHNKPIMHVDIGSRVDGFVAHVASFRFINVIDIRKLPNDIPNVKFLQSDLMKPIKEELIEYCDSLSCLHALEHFGLGRYGDPINYDGYLCGLKNLYSILKKNGKLYLSVPIGPLRIEFDAHRVFSVKYLMALFIDKYHIDSFSYVDDEGLLHEDVSITKENIANNFGCNYGCGIFEMTKV